MLAIIGGSGLSQLSSLNVEHREVIRTPYGDPSGPLLFGHVSNQKTVFLARHGYGHTIPPHRVNYRANIWAMKQAGANAIISVASVGGIAPHLPPGTLVIPDQIIDYTWGREHTCFDGGDSPVTHIDFTLPYDGALRARLLSAAAESGQTVVDGGVYAAMQGPRLETAAEIERLARDGADIVGMTGMPEAAIARELDMPYATIAVVVNWGAGRGDSVQAISLDDIRKVSREAMGHVRHVLDFFCEAE